MSKLPYMQFYVSDWTLDCACLSLSARGFWLEIICQMHHRNVGSVTATVEQFARMAKCTAEEAQSCIEELKASDIAEISTSYDDVTISCRRLKKEETERKRAAEGMKKVRELRKSYGSVTEKLQRNISESESEVIERQSARTGAHARSLSATDAATVEAIVDLYPRVQYRNDALKAVADAAIADADGKSIADALAFISAQTALFREAVGDDTAYVPDAVKWYAGGGYKGDAAKWKAQYCRVVKTVVSTQKTRATSPDDVGKGLKDNWEGQL